MAKYKLMKDKPPLVVARRKLWRIQCLTVVNELKSGDLGGWIEDERNLSQDGVCWVYPGAYVYGDAHVDQRAKIKGEARVFGTAYITGQAVVRDNAWVFGGATVSGLAIVRNDALVYGVSRLSGSVIIGGEVHLSDKFDLELGEGELLLQADIEDHLIREAM